jgi:hypothetical protein
MKYSLLKTVNQSVFFIRYSVFLLPIFLISFSQNISGAQVRGLVTDLNTREVLIGSTLPIKELKSETTSGLDRSYRLSNIPKGRYTLVVSYVGYKSKEIDLLVKSEDEIINLNVELASSDISIADVTITAFSEHSSDKSARFTEKMAPNILNVVSTRNREVFS